MNLYSAFFLPHTLGKVFGAVAYSVQPGKCILNFTFKDKCLIFAQLCSIFALVIICSKRFDDYYPINLQNVIILNLHIMNFVIPLMVVFISGGQCKVFRSLWEELCGICKELEGLNIFVDYRKFKEWSWKVFSLLYGTCLLYCLFDAISETSYIHTLIFYITSTLVAVSFETQMVVLLYIVWSLCEVLNENIEKCPTFLEIHYKLFTMGNKIKEVFRFYLIVRLFSTMYGISYCAYEMNMGNFELILFDVDCILWNLTNVSSMTLIMYYCQGTKLEVRN